MSAGSYDFVCEQGATFNRTLTIKDESGVGRDLSGHTARMQIRRRITDTTPLLSLTTENGRISMSSSGEVVLSVDADTTAALTDGGVYDLEIESSAGVVERVIEGNFILSLEVTR